MISKRSIYDGGLQDGLKKPELQLFKDRSVIPENLPSMLARALNILPQGIIVTERCGQLLWANAKASEVIDQKDGLLVHQGALRCSRAKDSATLLTMIESAAGSLSLDGFSSEGGLLSLTRKDETKLYLLVKPGWADYDTEVSTSRCVQTAILIVTYPSTEMEIPIELLMKVYGLTLSEARIASAIALGANTESFAETNSISVGTVRWHLKRVFEKTGTKRQSELVHFVLSRAMYLSTN